jgi:hypothetical protein
MNAAQPARRRARLQAIALVVLLAASALEIWAVAGGLDVVRDWLLVLIALTMAAAAVGG